jgi:hypothetical protein
MSDHRAEVEEAVARYVDIRRRIEGGEGDFGLLSECFTDDAVVIDAAWGRIEGLPAVSRWFVESMVGLEDWRFPIEFTAIEGDDVVIKWTQMLPGRRADGTPRCQSAYSRLVYAGDGKFSYEEDVYNMVHVLEDLEDAGWQPRGGTMNLPPAHPNRDFSIPGHKKPWEVGG